MPVATGFKHCPTLLLRETFVISYSSDVGDSADIRAGQFSEFFFRSVGCYIYSTYKIQCYSNVT